MIAAGRRRAVEFQEKIEARHGTGRALSAVRDGS